MLKAIRLLLVFTVLTGLVYPLLVTGLAGLLFPARAGGSLLYRGDVAVGSALVGQPFTSPGYFWPRPSATAEQPYNAMASGPSNLAPTSGALLQAVQGRVANLAAAGGGGPVPVDLVTASASGLDPDISPAAALYQVSRVAQARHLPEATVRDLVLRQVQGRTFGLLGEPRVNVLRLNLALDALAAR